MSLRCPQMLAFKKADLEVECNSLSGYTAAPAHYLKSVAVSTACFLDCSVSRKLSPAQSMHDGAGMALDEVGLQFELDRYLDEP